MSYPPEPFASKVDVNWAGKLVEDAIHAGSGPEASQDLVEAASWVQHAADYFRAGAALGGADAPAYASLNQEALKAKASMLQLANMASSLSGPQLKKFQQAILYPFQGVLGHIDRQLRGLPSC